LIECDRFIRRANYPPKKIEDLRSLGAAQSFVSVAIGSMQAARSAGTDTASAQDVTMTSRLAEYATGSGTWNEVSDLRGRGRRHQHDHRCRSQTAAGSETDIRAEGLTSDPTLEVYLPYWQTAMLDASFPMSVVFKPNDPGGARARINSSGTV